jgi:hypothetical protein
VTGDPGEAAPTSVEFDATLLEAKLSVPDTRPGSVTRAELIKAARASDRRVVGVTAPALQQVDLGGSVDRGGGSSGPMGIA